MSKPYPYYSEPSNARPHRLSDLLEQRDTVLSGLRHKVLELQHLNTLLGEFLDNPLLEHVRIAAFADKQQDGGGQLVLTADSPVWGHRVRYLAPAIVDFLHSRGELEHIHSARILVRPPHAGFTEQHEPRNASAEITECSARLLQQVANELDNPELAESLRRLSRRVEPS